MSVGPALAVFLLATNIAAVVAYLGLRRRHQRKRTLERGRKRGWGVLPVRRVCEILPELEYSDLGPGAATAVLHIANDHTPGAVSDYESWILCNLAKTSRHIFEFGTATGKTAYLLAANGPPDGAVVTVTLAPDAREEYRHAPGDGHADRRAAIAESEFERFVYTGTPAAQKITQLFMDSKTLDTAPYAGRMDLVFIDGSHARSYVDSDTNKALDMLRPQGTIVWHDYRGPDVTTGVFEALNERARRLPLVHLAGTSMVVYRKV